LFSENRVFTHQELALKVWGETYNFKGRSLDEHILRIRKAIGKNKIITLKGIGYKAHFPEV
jgi:DNA-binding response OmpR family regulator